MWDQELTVARLTTILFIQSDPALRLPLFLQGFNRSFSAAAAFSASSRAQSSSRKSAAAVDQPGPWVPPVSSSITVL